ncbi:hypothetical protein [Pseudoduganella violaceinigra]|uniref:hypothetical protein n=1 Tax=Pseudoduganella violaceinigra TaxID=246602 RepID=UPI0012B5FB64|nr:hypothetical protein [Pseudoduganella violaceinigra]
MRPGWNPTRRNRHAGTKANGLGRENSFWIPDQRGAPAAAIVVRRQVKGRDITFLVDPARPGYTYPCTVDDIAAVLEQVAAPVEIFVLRQPTRKQELHAPVWGRALWHFDEQGLQGPAIVLEAHSLRPYRWSRHIDPERARELARLRDDGQEVVKTRRGLEFRPTPSSMRNTVLFRTLLHEIGHHADYNKRGDQAYYQRTTTEREDFAYRYASEAQARLQRFAPIVDLAQMEAEGLDPAWFAR